MALFGRQVVLDIGQPGAPGKRFTDVRIVFRIQHSRSRHPGATVIEAFNLHPRTIAEAQRKGAVFRLLAGYDVPRQLFQGTAILNGVWSRKNGPDRMLHIEAQDGGDRYQRARVDVSFSTSTTLTQVLAVVTEQLGLPTGIIRIEKEITFPQGIALSGPARDVLDRLAASQDGDWFITDGALNLLPANGVISDTAIRISADNGNLIGSPRAKDNGIELTALLEPSLRPGRVFDLQSADFNGIYVCQDVVFQGDSGWDRPFYTMITARER